MRTLFLLTAAALAAAGCTPTTAVPAPPPVDVAAGLGELADVYKLRAAERRPPPAKLDDLAEYEAALPNAWAAVQEGRLVVTWKVGYAAGSADVLAHEKDAPTAGGSVLLRNGTVKVMTPAEFNAAPRAKK